MSLSESLIDLSNELELFGFLPLELYDDITDLPCSSNAFLSLIKTTWKLIELHRTTLRSNENDCEEISTLKRVNERLELQVTSLKHQISVSKKQVLDAINQNKMSNKSISENMKTEMLLQKECTTLRHQMDSLRLQNTFQTKKKDAEISKLCDKLHLLQQGPFRKPKIMPTSDQETLLKQVICKYQEANQKLVEENLELTAKLLQQKSEDDVR